MYLEKSNAFQKIFKNMFFTLEHSMYFTDSTKKVIENVYLLLKFYKDSF